MFTRATCNRHPIKHAGGQPSARTMSLRRLPAIALRASQAAPLFPCFPEIFWLFTFSLLP